MPEVSQLNDDEIDLFELFETLWRGKWFISGFVAISVLLGGGFLFITTPIYESKLVFLVENAPPFYEPEKVESDFKKLFYTKSSFEGWKSENAQSELDFEEFNITEVINGFTFVKEEGDLLANIVKEKSLSALVVKANKLSLLNEFFDYENFVNNKLTSDYVLRAKDELKVIGTGFDVTSLMARHELAINRFIVSAERGSKVMALNPPTFPKKISPKIKLTLASSIVLGGMIGVMYVLVFNAIRKRKVVLSRLQ
jgi:hypothetical protein